MLIVRSSLSPRVLEKLNILDLSPQPQPGDSGSSDSSVCNSFKRTLDFFISNLQKHSPERKKSGESESMSAWADAPPQSIVYLPSHFEPKAFRLFLEYAYTGSVTVRFCHHAYLILIRQVPTKELASGLASIAFEYLLDRLMRFCDRAPSFPATIEVCSYTYFVFCS